MRRFKTKLILSHQQIVNTVLRASFAGFEYYKSGTFWVGFEEISTNFKRKEISSEKII